MAYYIETVMTEKVHLTSVGEIHYWVKRIDVAENLQQPWLIFLPGMTADHRFFETQIVHFQNQYNCLVWDAPGHGKSRPASLDFSLHDLACYLHDILVQEQATDLILIGHSMGGYIAQLYQALYPSGVAGLVSIDSSSLECKYYEKWELCSLKHTKAMYQAIPWNLLVQWSAIGNAETEHGRNLMQETMMSYTRNEFCNLAGHGFRILAEAIEQYGSGPISCPVLLLCGAYDKTGFVKRYNRTWTKESGYPLVWIPKAGHMANTDNPQAVNAQIEHFLKFATGLNK